eukprot:6711888-Alexandrium_andersonii.AAC.1
MSASLVGSEMCIRDSFSALQRASARFSALQRSSALSSAPERSSARFSACLLYTSDAADDM